MFKRNRKLISESLKWFLIPVLLSSAVGTVNTIVDSILMGRFLGPEAFSAINVSLPLLNGIVAFGVLVVAGAAALVSQKIGERDMDGVVRIFSTSVVCVIVVSIAKVMLALFFIDPLAALVCKEASLLPLVRQYCRTCIILGFVTDINIAMCRFANVAGYPKWVSVSNCFIMIVNIMMDVLLVGVLHMGIQGAAFATILGNLAGSIILVPYYFSKKSIFRFRPAGLAGQVKDNIAYGVPALLGILGVSIMSFSMNYFVQINIGKDGLFVMSIFLVFSYFASFIAGGSDNTFLALGKLMMGQKDKDGLRILLRTCFCIDLVSTLVLSLIMFFLPGQLARLFGADSQALIDITVNGLRIMSLCVVFVIIALSLATIYQVFGHLTMSYFVMILAIALPPVVMGAFTLWASPGLIWYAPPAAGLLCLLIILVVSELYRRKQKNCGFFFLLPLYGEDIRHFEMSIASDTENLSEALRVSHPFFESLETGSYLDMRVRLCMEEMMAYIVAGEQKGKNESLDVMITAGSDEISVMVKDDGMPYNPLEVSKDDYELKVINHYCPCVEYQFCYGQNMTFLTWPLNESNKV